jgi:hypothetical protein
MLAYVHLTKWTIYVYMHGNKPPGSNYSTVWSVALKVYARIPFGCWLGADLQKHFMYAHKCNKYVPKIFFTVPHHRILTQIVMSWLESCQILLLLRDGIKIATPEISLNTQDFCFMKLHTQSITYHCRRCRNVMLLAADLSCCAV